jgi:enoyl-CoA hydratase
VLRLKKLAINRAAEAAGFRQALSGIAEIDALLHLSPAVLAIRERMKARRTQGRIQEFIRFRQRVHSWARRSSHG